MKIIKQSAEIINTSFEDINPLKIIEIAGRTCYKSENSVTEESSEQFFKQLVNNGHFAMLEHANFIFEVDRSIIQHFIGKPFVRVSSFTGTNYIVSANLRAIKENKLKPLQAVLILSGFDNLRYYFDSPFDYKSDILDLIKLVTSDRLKELLKMNHSNPWDFKEHITLTARFITNRGVTHELVRHRPASFAQESTRYCNYSKDKFNKELTFIEPSDFGSYNRNTREGYLNLLKHLEFVYMTLTNDTEDKNHTKLTAQQARGMLPNDIKTEIIVTATLTEWEHILDLRLKGLTGKPHPDMKDLMEKFLVEYKRVIHEISLNIYNK